MAAEVLYLQETIVSMGPCITCGLQITGPRGFYEQRTRDQKSFYCVNGHAQHFIGQTKEQQLEAQLAAARRDAEYQRSRRALAERQVSAARGQVTKIRNRVGNGVCPCCNRTFQNLLRHMSTQHPEFKHEEHKS